MCNIGMLRVLKIANVMALKWQISAKGWRQTDVKEGLVLAFKGAKIKRLISYQDVSIMTKSGFLLPLGKTIYYCPS